jgi:2-oxoglutarate/2-oxoacid ferredoxin oxidoreductase subunit alpha
MRSDLDIGMNDWVTPRLKWEDGFRPDRGRVLSTEDLETVTKYFRYSPWDENFVAARTLPGVDARGAYFIRGSGHNKLGAYTEIPDEYREVVDRLAQKHEAAKRFVPGAEIARRDGARFGLIGVGGCDPALREAVDILAAQGIPADYMRIRAFPFDASVEAFLAEHERLFVVEQNRDAQLKALLTLETNAPKEKLRSILVYGGFPLSARHVLDRIWPQLDEHAVTPRTHV